MSETQIIKKVIPTVRVSSTDSHRMLTPPAAAAQVRAGTRPPRTGGQPMRAGEPDVKFKTQPMDIVMHGGGSVKVEQPGGALRRPVPRASGQFALPAPAPALAPEQVELCGILVSNALSDLERNEAPPAEIAIARGTLVALAKLRQK